MLIRFLIGTKGKLIVIETVVGVYLHYVDGYLQELGADSGQVFRHAGLAYPGYAKPGERVSLIEIANLVAAVGKLAKKTDFFLQLGKRIPLTAHGNLGVAMLGCKDVRTLLLLSEKFVPLAISSLRLSLKEESHRTVFTIHAETGFPLLDIAIVEVMLGTLAENLRRLSGVAIQPERICIGHQQPDCFLSYQALLNCPIEFASGETALHFVNKKMLLPIQTADTLGSALLVEQCDEELKQIQLGSSFTQRISEIVMSNLASSPSITFVADKMQLSERSLRRRLAEDNTNYRELVKKIRHEKAIYFLDKTDARIERIACDLGYKESANFRRAFKEQTGFSPRAWRNAKG